MEIPTVLEQICTDCGMCLKYTERKRLVNFAFVQAQRIRQGHVLTELADLSPVAADDDGPDFGPLNQFWGLEDEDLRREKQYLTIYCRVNELLDFQLINVVDRSYKNVYRIWWIVKRNFYTALLRTQVWKRRLAELNEP